MTPARDPAVEELERLTWVLDAPSLRTVGGTCLRACEDRLVALLTRSEPPTVSGFLEPLDRILLEVRDVGNHGDLVFNVHPDPAVRDAGRELSEAAERFYTTFRLNARAYERLAALDLASVDLVTRRTVEKMRQEMRRSGVEQGPESRARLQELADAITFVGNRFTANIANGTRHLEVTDPAELAGLPVDFVAAHPPGPGGRIRLTTQYPDYEPVMAYGDRADLRRRLLVEFANRGFPENLAALSELLGKRYEFARRLGYPDYSALVLEDKMTKRPETVRAFLEHVTEVLRPGTELEMDRLLARKRRDRPEEPRLDLWDEGYYRNKIKNEEYGVDARTLRRYLPYGPVRDGLFALCSELFDLAIRPAEAGGLWHASVEAYDVAHQGTPIGRFYLDMVPRDGKFSHAACFGVRTGREGLQGPEAALVCNFVDAGVPKETARMEYRNVVTFFHEFGHLLHAMFSGRMPWTYAHQLEMDFVEAPSLLFEEWARDPATLGRFARDPDTGAKIPAEILRRLEASEAFGRASFWMRQVALSAIAFDYYNRDPAGLDTTRLYEERWRAHRGHPYPAGTHPEASWGHLVGYSACYYTYVWSLTIARDLLSPFRAKGSLTDPVLAQRYAREILAAGGRRPAAESVEAFLGRPSNLEAFGAWVREASSVS